jgi:hypothetical protein
MSFAGAYLTRTVTWRKRGEGYDRQGRPLPGEEREISVRWEGNRALVRDAQGEQVVSEALVFCREPVSSGDALVDEEGRDWQVISVSEQYGLDGRISHREVRL